MMPRVGSFAYSLAALAWLMEAGCGLDQPPCAAVGGQLILAATPLALTQNAVLLRAGDGFVLAGFDGTTVRWGQLSVTGEIAQESAFVLPEQPATTTGGRPLGPVFAVTSKTVPGDQLVATIGVLTPGTTDHYEVHAYVQDLGSTEMPTMQLLGEQAAAPASGTVRLVAGSSPSGQAALVFWGVEGQLAPINYQVLGAGGLPTGGVRKLFDPSNPVPRWTCLDATQSLSSLAITLVEATDPDQASARLWHRFELSEDGSVSGEALAYLRYPLSDCRIASTPTADALLLTWQNSLNEGGTYFALMTPPGPDAAEGTPDNVTSKPVLSSESFGGYARMPKLAWVAPAGYEFTIGLDRSKGPEVVRFNIFSDPRGEPLFLPSLSGHTGPVSTWVGPDLTYVTYLDFSGPSAGANAAPPPGSRRLFLTVRPTTLP
jgi:hypothetical protein